MECPACGYDRHTVIEVKRASDMDERRVECSKCGAQWYTETRQGDLFVLEPATMKRRRIPRDRIEEYRDFILGRGRHPRPWRE